MRRSVLALKEHGRAGAGRAGTPAGAPGQERPRGWLGPFVQPRVTYVLTFLGLTGLLFITFNPVFGAAGLLGVEALQTPLELLRGPDGSWFAAWHLPQRVAAFLTAAALLFLVVSLWPPRRGRGALALGGVCFALVSHLALAPDLLAVLIPHFLYVGAGLLGGALWAGGARGTPPVRRAFWVGLLLLGSVFFMPLSTEESRRPGFAAQGPELVEAYLSPPQAFDGITPPGPGEAYDGGRLYLFYLTLPETLVLLLLVLGLVSLALPRGRWLGASSGLLLWGLFVGSALVWGLHAASERYLPGQPPLASALAALGELWRHQFLLFVLPLAGAVADLSHDDSS